MSLRATGARYAVRRARSNLFCCGAISRATRRGRAGTSRRVTKAGEATTRSPHGVARGAALRLGGATPWRRAVVRRRLPLPNHVLSTRSAFEGANRRIDVRVRQNVYQLHRATAFPTSRRREVDV
jgi:hypothetical protein